MAGAPTDLIDKAMWSETYNQFTDAIKTGFGEVEWGQPDWMLNQNLKYNAATFAAFKNHAETKEIQKLLLDGDKVRKWKAFRDQALAISEKYNRRWLQTEYNHAVQSSRMARKWQDAVGDSDLYPNLKYVTAGDERVRHSHKDLNGAIYPINDPFWNTYYPPNGWGCRCTVRPTDQPTKQAAGLPEMPDMFKTNPGKTGNMFSEQNPYAAKATATEKKEIEKFVKENVVNPNAFTISKDVKTIEDLNDVMKDFATAYPDLFARGFKGIQSTTKYGVNGFTDRFGNIALKGNKINDVKNAFNNIKNNIPTTFEQEDSLSTLWHEILHNSSKLTNRKRSTELEIHFMELNNEMVSRKTLPDFMLKLGGKLNNTELISNRVSTGYNARVRNFERLIKHTDADFDSVISQMKINNIETPLEKHREALVDVIMKNTKRKYGKMDVKTALSRCTYSSEDYCDTLLENILKEKK